MNTLTFGLLLAVAVLLGNQQPVHAACDLDTLVADMAACPTIDLSGDNLCDEYGKLIDCQAGLLDDCDDPFADTYKTALEAFRDALTDLKCDSGSSRMSALLMTVILPLFVLLKLH